MFATISTLLFLEITNLDGSHLSLNSSLAWFRSRTSKNWWFSTNSV